jgi:hypothetical protein
MADYIAKGVLMPSWLTSRMYDADVLRIAAGRGYDDEAHRAALVADTRDNGGRGDSDAVALTHPANWLTEDEVEALTR